MHGTLDFLTCQALRETFATRQWSLSRLAAYLENYRAGFPVDFSRPAFIENHDMNRFFFTALGSSSAQEAALRLLYLLPGAPIVYYGCERELTQRQSIHANNALGFDEARAEMDWERQSEANSAKVMREMAAFRKSNPWLVRAHWQTLELAPEIVVFQAGAEENRVRVVIRREGDEWRLTYG
jgi:glycosidase